MARSQLAAIVRCQVTRALPVADDNDDVGEPVAHYSQALKQASTARI
jgi:hypothetical protein